LALERLSIDDDVRRLRHDTPRAGHVLALVANVVRRVRERLDGDRDVDLVAAAKRLEVLRLALRDRHRVDVVRPEVVVDLHAVDELFVRGVAQLEDARVEHDPGGIALGESQLRFVREHLAHAM